MVAREEDYQHLGIRESLEIVGMSIRCWEREVGCCFVELKCKRHLNTPLVLVNLKDYVDYIRFERRYPNNSVESQVVMMRKHFEDASGKTIVG